MERETFIQRHRELVEENNHTEAAILLAEFIGFIHYVEVLRCVLRIQEIEGEMPEELSTYRYRLLQGMKPAAQSALGADYARIG